MVHARFEEPLAVQPNPQADSAQSRSWRQLIDGEINLRFARHQIHVREDDNANDRLLGNLRAPARFRARVIALAPGKPEFKQKLVQIHETFARTTECMVIVIAPAKAQLVLPALLNLSRAIPALPIFALGFE